MLPRDEAALRLHQANRGCDGMQALLDEFFGRIVSATEYDRIQSRVSEIMSCPEITGSQSLSLSLEAL